MPPDHIGIVKAELCLLMACVLFTGCRHIQQERFPADVRINDKLVRFIYDTGAGVTFVHTGSAKRLGLKAIKPPSSPKPPPGKVNTGQTELCRFTAGQYTYRLKLTTVHPPWPWGGLMDFDGAIGWPDLKDDFFVIDAAHDVIKGVDMVPQTTNGWTKLPLSRHTDVLALEIPRADGKTGVLEVDTGNAEGVSLSPARWKEWRTTHHHAHGGWQFNFMFGSGPAFGRTYKAEDLAIGPLTWKQVTIRKARRTETNIADGKDVFEASIGIAALRQLNLVIDRTNRMAYVRRDPDWDPGQEAHRPKAPRTAMASTNSTVRLNFQAHEYAALAQMAFDSGKYDDAVTNITRLLELEPDNAGALAGRAGALLRLHGAEPNGTNLDQSLADLNRVLELVAGNTPSYEQRASIYYLTQRWDNALKDYRCFCEKAPSQANYQRFYIWLIRARKGELAAADQELGAWFGPGKKPKANRWERTIAAFLLGHMSEAEFLDVGRRGHDSGRQCEAWFYAGMKRLLSGDAATARDDFQKCLATGRKDYDEYNFAAAELRMVG
jgi:lipoprotein NlpI